MANSSSSSVKKIAIAIAVILVLVAGTSLLMTALRSMKISSFYSRADFGSGAVGRQALEEAPQETTKGASTPAHVKRFVATMDLTPRLSVGTDQPESIYEARLRTEISALQGDPGVDLGEVRLPLPPQLISLADVAAQVNGQPDDSIRIEGNSLVWRGHLDPKAATKIEIAYTAIGQGIYVLEPPSGRIVEDFETTLTAHGSDIRVLQLSLQPQKSRPEPGQTSYTWKYKRLMFGRPIALDVLGIAPRDRLAELGWLGPISVLVFGLLVALVALAYRPEKLDGWMLLLIVGAFTGAYPLMYFSQDLMAVELAVVLAMLVVLVIIGLRGVTLLGTRLGLVGTVLLAAVIQTITVCAALWPEKSLLGVLLTVLAIGALVVAMILLPRVQANLAAEAAIPPGPASGSAEAPAGEPGSSGADAG